MSDDIEVPEKKDYLIGNDVMIGLTGRVTEYLSATQENTVKVEEMIEPLQKLAGYEKQLETMGERCGGLEGRMREMVSEVRHLKEAVGMLPGQVVAPMAAIEGLRGDLVKHAELFEKPLSKEVRHRHFLGRPFIVLLLMGMAMAWLIVIWW